MLSSLLRPQKARRRIDRSPFSTPNTGSPEDLRRARPAYERQRTADDDQPSHDEGTGQDEEDRTYDDLDEDEDEEPLLPIFSAAHLDALPVYNITHAIRMLIIPKCETTLSWEQLRTPQISQFLVKPIQTQIRANHFNRATLLALIANCLQFKKEAETNLGMAGTNKTRALLAELLAMRLLREYSTRELIDALSYDFDPLKGIEEAGTQTAARPGSRPRLARISTVEIAIRASSKKFLAHPLVVQQLEAIWAGSIVFHSAADNLHRRPQSPRQRPLVAKTRGYGTIEDRSPSPRTAPAKGKAVAASTYPVAEQYARRSATLYDPRDASLFKLSRLRVPRYRQLFSTISFAVMLGLFLAVLLDRSKSITVLEIVFWLYSAGYMLDEVVGFTEQGFGLYIISVWNAFDLGILILFFIYYVLRLYGLFIADSDRTRIANMAYDVLASTAVLLFPRAFNVLDHYRYFSQLLIAFRMMAQDLVAVLVLIVITCSGFFVAFTLSFSTDANSAGKNVAYALFQMVMGFTPAAWSAWDNYNVLGRIVLTLFLFICHFLIVTILVSVLSNSFMAVVQNANEEHQFLFAVNAISMVKSDALFSYIPPTNLLSWIVSPLRFLVPFRHFVKLNRTIIKVTHFPILFSIFAYERLVWAKMIYEPTDLVVRPLMSKASPAAFGPDNQPEPAARLRRLREPSVMSYKKDQALEEVFRRPFRGSTVRTTAQGMDGNRKPSTVVDTWMQNVGKEGGAGPPQEQPRSVLDRLESRRPTFRRGFTAERMKSGNRDLSAATKSIVSDPEEGARAGRRPNRIEEEEDIDMSMETIQRDIDGDDGDDGDDELMTHDEADNATIEKSPQQPRRGRGNGNEHDKENAIPRNSSSSSDYFATPVAAALGRSLVPSSSTPGSADLHLRDSNQTQRPSRGHDRNVSNSTTIFQPQLERAISSSSEVPQVPLRQTRPGVSRHGTSTPVQAGPSSRGQKLHFEQPVRPRPALQSRQSHLSELRAQPVAFNRRNREPSFNAIALDLASDLGDNRFNQDLIDVGGISGMPASFSEQMFRERELARQAADERRRSEQEEKEVLGRMMLTRMNTLELGFREVVTAVREMRNEASRAGTGSERGVNSAGERPPFKGRGSSGLSLEPSAANSAASSTAGSGMPRTPGGRVLASGKEKKSPRKLRRPTTLRYDTTNATAAATAGEASYAAVAAQPPAAEEQKETQLEVKGKSPAADDGSSPTHVKTMVKDLERRVSQKRSSSSSQPSVSGQATDVAVIDTSSPEAAVATARMPLYTDEEAAEVRAKRESVIYVGPGPVAAAEEGKE